MTLTDIFALITAMGGVYVGILSAMRGAQAERQHELVPVRDVEWEYCHMLAQKEVELL